MQNPLRSFGARTSAIGGVALVLLLGPTDVRSQTPTVDAAEVLEHVQELQRDFERYRESRTPVEVQRVDGACDERIGRICIWFGGEEEERFPAEFREVQQARVELIRELFDAFEQVPHRWVLGQLVHYLAENGNRDEGERVARECGIAEQWWCSALLGYALHMQARHTEAEAAFREALDDMPDAEWEEWTTRYVFTGGTREAFDSAPPTERDLRWELFWRLSDPLFLFNGNDRLTDHFARWVVATNRREATDPLGLEWEEDLEETLIRYGMNIGYSRVHDPARTMSGGGLQDTRRMVGHHHPKSRGYLFPEEFLESPSDIPPESWITAPREARTWYAPPYAPEIRGLETQVGRFRRDDQMLVVGAYRPTVPEEDDTERVFAWAPPASAAEPPHSALFLIPVDGQAPLSVRGRDTEGVLTLEARPGRYVSGLEVVDLEGRQAWRARQGVIQLPLATGELDVSDLMILEEGAPLTESLEEATPYLRPGVRVRRGERFGVLWEVYGLRVLEPVRVTIGFSRGRPGFLTRVGEFLGVIEPAQDLDVTFDEVGPESVQTVFRSMEMELPDLDPGEYTLHLRLERAGRDPVVTSRPIIVER
jgi:hypothetical protein